MNYSLPEIKNGISKSQVSILASSAVSDLLESGKVIEAAEAISAMELFIKQVKADKRFIGYVRDEVSKFGKSTSLPSGSQIELAETGTKYNYEQCNDFVLPMLEQKMESIKEDIEKRQNFLKTLPIEGLDIMDETTGELVKVYPPSKTSTSSYKITLAK